jgi:hypothetical protein
VRRAKDTDTLKGLEGIWEKGWKEIKERKKSFPIKF